RSSARAWRRVCDPRRLRAQCRNTLHHRSRYRHGAVQSCRWWTGDREEPRIECENELRRTVAESREAPCEAFPVSSVVYAIASLQLRQRRSDSFFEWSDRFKRPSARIWPNAKRSASSIYFLGSVSTAGPVEARADSDARFVCTDRYPASRWQFARL